MRVKRTSARALVAVVLPLAACGEGSQERTERAFLQAMVPHHRSAVDMAEAARTEARTEFVKELARDITRTQTAETARMERLHERLFDAPLEPDMGAHSALGLSAQEAGMNHTEGAAMIRGRKPFDRAFVDEMVPHHEGATRMAEVVLAKAEDRELRRLLQGIVAAQKREITAMESFREQEYGATAAAGRGGGPG